MSVAKRSPRRLVRTVLVAAAATSVAVPAIAAGAATVGSLDGRGGWFQGHGGQGSVAVDAAPDADNRAGALLIRAVGGDDWAYAYKPHRVPLQDVRQLSYRTKRDVSSTAPAGVTASFQLQIDCNGSSRAGGQTPIGYFPFLNPEQGAVVPGRWQQWDAAGGLWYSPAHLGPAGAVSEEAVAGSVGGRGDYRPLADVRTACPDGEVVGFGVAHGRNSAGLTSYADDVVFNGQAVDFAAGASAAPPARFADVPTGHPFHAEIEWLAGRGITRGVGDGTRFGTTAPVQRQQMAAFLFRLSGETGYRPPSRASFTDVPASRSLYTAVEWLAGKGITKGVGDGTFGAELPVQRQQMAAFLFRYSGDTAYRPPAASRFSDVPTSHPFYTEISWLADSGITLGVGGGRFDTASPVQRQHMAAFLSRFEESR